ncbi:MAG: hypothetical protein D6835_06455, partial [Candidatus Thermofonsia bacterium]
MSPLTTWLELVTSLPEVEGVSMMDLLHYPPRLRQLLQQLLRQRRVTAVTLSQLLELPEQETAQLLSILIYKGYLQSAGKDASGHTLYRVRLQQVHGRNLSNLPD